MSSAKPTTTARLRAAMAVPGEHHQVAAEFIAACASGDLAALLRVLDPDVVGDVDLGPGVPARRPLRGSRIVSRRRARGARGPPPRTAGGGTPATARSEALTEPEMRGIVSREHEELCTGAEETRRLGQAARAEELGRQAAILGSYLGL